MRDEQEVLTTYFEKRTINVENMDLAHLFMGPAVNGRLCNITNYLRKVHVLLDTKHTHQARDFLSLASGQRLQEVMLEVQKGCGISLVKLAKDAKPLAEKLGDRCRFCFRYFPSKELYSPAEIFEGNGAEFDALIVKMGWDERSMQKDERHEGVFESDDDE